MHKVQGRVRDMYAADLSARRAIVTARRIWMHFVVAHENMNLSFVFLCFLAVFVISEGGLISQSSIQSCDWGDSNEPTTKEGAGCKEKLVVSMTLKSGQVHVL